jgi:protease-4
MASKLKDDSGVAGVVLEIDSGGGGAYASEMIYKEIKKLNEKKPVYAYFQNTAASGGYYISCATSGVYSSPYCLTGSIGTVMLRPDFLGLYKKLGIKKDRVGFYPKRDILSEYGKLSKESVDYLKHEIHRVKDQFYSRVADSRKLDVKDIEKVGGGRVFTGEEFFAKNMVDGNQGMLDVVKILKAKCGLDKVLLDYRAPQYGLRSFFKEFSVVNLRSVMKNIKYLQNKEEIIRMDSGL